MANNPTKPDDRNPGVSTPGDFNGARNLTQNKENTKVMQQYKRTGIKQSQNLRGAKRSTANGDPINFI
jgi:hypothetical protein